MKTPQIWFLFHLHHSCEKTEVKIANLSYFELVTGSGARREGDVEGVRQSRGNWQREDIHWTQRQLVRPLDSSSLNNSRARM